MTKKIKDVEAGTKLDFDTIDKFSINDVFKISSSDSKGELALIQLKDQYTSAKQDILIDLKIKF